MKKKLLSIMGCFMLLILCLGVYACGGENKTRINLSSGVTLTFKEITVQWGRSNQIDNEFLTDEEFIDRYKQDFINVYNAEKANMLNSDMTSKQIKNSIENFIINENNRLALFRGTSFLIGDNSVTITNGTETKQAKCTIENNTLSVYAENNTDVLFEISQSGYDYILATQGDFIPKLPEPSLYNINIFSVSVYFTPSK